MFGFYSESANGLRCRADAGIGDDGARRGRRHECRQRVLNGVDLFELGPFAGSEAFTLVLSTRAADGAAGLGDGATG